MRRWQQYLIYEALRLMDSLFPAPPHALTIDKRVSDPAFVRRIWV